MQLVVYGRESLCELEQLVQSKFATVVNRGLTVSHFPGGALPLTPSYKPLEASSVGEWWEKWTCVARPIRQVGVWSLLLLFEF